MYGSTIINYQTHYGGKLLEELLSCHTILSLSLNSHATWNARVISGSVKIVPKKPRAGDPEQPT